MILLLRIFMFNIFYHITFILTYDVYKYHKENNIVFLDNFKKEIIHLISLPIITFILWNIFMNLFDIPILLDIISYFFLGFILTRDIWLLYLYKMTKYENTYFYTFSKMEPYYLKKYCKNSSKSILNKIPKEKIIEIQNFIKKYPYKLIVKKTNRINSYADLEKNEIMITEGSLNLPINEIKAMLAHEIMHFQVDGKVSVKKRKIIFFILLYFLILLFYIVAILIKDSYALIRLIFILLLCIYLFYFVFFHVVIPERYLFQLSELKCDRLACLIDGVKKEDMLALLNRLKSISNNKSNEKLYLKIIKRYFLFYDHPNISYRIKKIKKYREWSIIDYITLPIHLIKQLLIGKGWNYD